MDRAYSGDQTRRLAFDMGFTPVVPPLKSRVDPWEYDKELYKRRNEVERLFRRLKGYRRVFTRYDKLDALYAGFVLFAIIFDALRSVTGPSRHSGQHHLCVQLSLYQDSIEWRLELTRADCQTLHV